jgi:hypothetical protein
MFNNNNDNDNDNNNDNNNSSQYPLSMTVVWLYSSRELTLRQRLLNLTTATEFFFLGIFAIFLFCIFLRKVQLKHAHLLIFISYCENDETFHRSRWNVDFAIYSLLSDYKDNKFVTFVF